jgi:putative ABC transport system permease protein
MNDLRIAFRQLLKNPGFTAVAVVVLALGIGANTAIFSLVNTLLLTPISGHEPERLVGLYSRDIGRADSYRLFSHPHFADLRAFQEVFEDVLAMMPSMPAVLEGDTARRVLGMKISANYFSVFGVRPAHGRAFLPEEERNPTPVVVVSHSWWQRQGAPADLIGQSIQINGRPSTVVGIAPRGFTGTVALFSPDFYLPLAFDRLGAPAGDDPTGDRTRQELMLVGRLKRGISIEEADARLRVFSDQLATAFPEADRDHLITVARLPRMAFGGEPVDDHGRLRVVSLLMMILALVVLLIACLNLANMQLARGAARRGEIAVRLAIGGRPARILRQLLVEGLLLALLGGAAGLVLATLVTGRLVDSLASIAPVSLNLSTRPDPLVLSATLMFSVLATLLFALGPARRILRVDLHSGLKGRAAEERTVGTILSPRNWLAIGQIALSLGLLVVAGLAGRGALHAVRIDPGFDLDRGFYLYLDGEMARYDENRARQVYQGLLERVGALPGVESASMAATVPLGDLVFGQGVQRGGAPYPPPEDARTVDEGKAIAANFNVIGPDYFRTLGIPLRQGREFRRVEFTSTNAPAVAIINSKMAEELWPGQDPIGRTIQFAHTSDPEGERSMGAFIPAGAPSGEPFEVVGVVPRLRDQLLRRDDKPMVFIPFGRQYRATMALHVRAASPAGIERLIGSVRDIIRETDPALPVLETRSLRSHFENSLGVWLLRSGAWLFAAFGAVALALSVIGVYAVKTYLVARRTREMGVRMALGATGPDILRLVLRDGMKVTLIGLGLGVVLAVMLGHLVRGILFQVSPLDPLVYGAAIVLLASSAMLACWLPARRASRVDPMKALRHE